MTVMDSGGSTPRPDPTILTTEQLLREVGALRDNFNGQLAIRDERLLGIDRATVLRWETIAHLPRRIDEEIAHLRDLMDARYGERFNAIALQFTERDTRSDQASRSSADALAAALQAAKELVGAQGEASAAAAVKSETSFTKQIDQIGTIIQTLEKALDARITELKERIDRGEGSTAGAHDNTSEVATRTAALRQTQAIALSVLLFILAAVTVAVSVYAANK